MKKRKSDQPVSVDRFIKLITNDELDKDDVKTWFRCVKKNAPSGTLHIVNIVNHNGKPCAVSLLHRVNDDDKHSYIVPLTRDLSADEIEKIVKEFAEDKPDLDFDVETHETTLTARDHEGIKIDSAKHVALCTALEKQKHEDWVRERTSAGWRYGTTFNADEMTHPLLRPWDQLPDRYKEPDMNWPQKLVTMLNDQGYAIVQKDELERLLSLLR